VLRTSVPAGADALGAVMVGPAAEGIAVPADIALREAEDRGPYAGEGPVTACVPDVASSGKGRYASCS